jgi:hypothetical protein
VSRNDKKKRKEINYTKEGGGAIGEKGRERERERWCYNLKGNSPNCL